MLDVSIIKLIHMNCAGISISGFVIRGILRLRRSAILQQRWIRIAPHIVDAILLISAIALVMMLQLNILAQPWLMAKIIALLLYIFLGLVTLRFAKTTAAQLFSFIGAVLIFAYIVHTALTHQINPFPGML